VAKTGRKIPNLLIARIINHKQILSQELLDIPSRFMTILLKQLFGERKTVGKLYKIEKVLVLANNNYKSQYLNAFLSCLSHLALV
jgi:hypothetical protein